MKLIIGGYAQGKLEYVLQSGNPEDYIVLDGTMADNALEVKEPDTTSQQKTVILNHFHSWVKDCIRGGGCPEKESISFVQKHPDCIIISDEIGNGIVPVDAFEREYRERTGRILIELAEYADEVVRVICGIGQKIK